MNRYLLAALIFAAPALALAQDKAPPNVSVPMSEAGTIIRSLDYLVKNEGIRSVESVARIVREMQAVEKAAMDKRAADIQAENDKLQSDAIAARKAKEAQDANGNKAAPAPAK